MINKTEFGDLDAGDIYMPLGDISGFGDYLLMENSFADTLDVCSIVRKVDKMMAMSFLA